MTRIQILIYIVALWHVHSCYKHYRNILKVLSKILHSSKLTFQNLSASSASLTGEREVLSGGFFISKPCARKNVATGEKYSDAQNHAPQWGNPIKLII